MQTGYLIVNVYLDTVGMPVEGATVTVTGENYERIFTTDISGKTEKIPLSAPDKKYSLAPQYNVRPYSKYDVKVTKEGLNPIVIKNVEVLPDETSLQDVYMHKYTGKEELIDLPEHCLWGDECPPNMEVAPINPNNELNRILPRVIIPEFIRVKNGTPTSSAAVLNVEFIYYIKNVASSEIFSTWHPEAIKANVHAIVSFTLNRIFTEWYTSRGFNFTISASPRYDQKYTHGRTIFQTISNIVDEYFRYYIRLDGYTHPFFAQYNDGIQTNIPGRLSQWGSQNLAQNRGFRAIDILKHYYTPRLGLFVAPQVVGLPNSFPGINLSMGSCGEAVGQMQNRLNRIRTHFPAIPVIQPANGEFNESTRRSVETFQRVFNIPVTGVVNWATWFRISNVFIGVARLQAGV